MSEFSDLLHSRLPEGWSVREVARQAGRKGYTIKPATVTALFAGKVKEPTRESLEALAGVLPVTVNELRAALALPPVRRRWEPPEEAHSLTPEVQDALSVLIKRIVNGGTDAGNTGEKSPRPGEPGNEDGGQPAKPTKPKPGGGGPGNVRRMTPKERRFHEQAQPVETAADRERGE